MIKIMTKTVTRAMQIFEKLEICEETASLDPTANPSGHQGGCTGYVWLIKILEFIQYV